MKLEIEKLDQLDRIEAKLNSITAALKEPLGFLESIGRRYITVRDVKTESGSVYFWHFWDKANQKQIPIFTNSLRGYVTGIEIFEAEFKGKPTPKLSILLDCGSALYGIQSQTNTLFSRSALLALTQVKDFNLPLTITVREGTEQNALFCSVWSGGEYMKNSWEKKSPAPPIAPQMQEINTRLGYTPKPKISPEAQKFLALFYEYATNCDSPEKLIKLTEWCDRNQPAGIENQVKDRLAELAVRFAESAEILF